MSVVLRKCRTLFNDELLVRHGRGFAITPHGVELLSELHRALGAVAAVLSPNEFDSGTCTRAFTIAASDYVFELLAIPLAQRLSACALGVTINFAPLHQMNRRIMPEFLIVPPQHALRHGEEVLRDDWVAVSGPGRFTGPPVRAIDLESMRHVRYSFAGSTTVSDGALDALGLSLRVPVRAPDFATALRLAAAGDLVAVLPRRLVTRYARTIDFSVAELDVAIPPLTEILSWPASFDRDAAHRWLRGQLRECAREED